MGRFSDYIDKQITGVAGDLKTPHGKIKTRNKFNALGVDSATLDGYDSTEFQLVANKGVANGYAPLDGSNKIPKVHLPSVGGWNMLTPNGEGRWMNGSKKPKERELDLWDIDDSYGYEFTVPVDYVPGTPLYACILWSGLQAQNMTNIVYTQFDVSVSAGLLGGKMRGIKEITLLGYHASKFSIEELKANEEQRLLPIYPIKSGDVIMLQVTRVTPIRNKRKNKKDIVVWYPGLRYSADQTLISNAKSPLVIG